MGDERRTTERWALVGVGQCGRRVAATVYERAADRSVGDRTVLIDTAPTPRRHTVDRLASALAVERSIASRDHLVTFEADAGLGRTVFDDPAAATAEAASLAESVSEATADADAIVHLLGLGGQIGNSVVPRVIDHLSSPSEETTNTDSGCRPHGTERATQFALGVWPFEYESQRRHFDAVCGLARLLRCEDGTPNADMTLLVANSRLADVADRVGIDHDVDPAREGSERYTDEFRRINDVIADAIRTFIGPERTPRNTDRTAIPTDLPHRCDVRHGTVGIAPATPIGIGLPFAIRRAVENAFVPLDPSTVEAAYVVVRAPKPRVEAGDVTERDVREAFAAWSSAGDRPDPTGGARLSVVPGDGHTMDVLVFLGGFDLSPLLSTSWDGYETFKAPLLDSGSDELVERTRRLEANLRAYCDPLDPE